MSTPTSGGAAFNPAVRTEDNTPAPEPEGDRADDQRDCGETNSNREDQA
jgi:hypothetical protein